MYSGSQNNLYNYGGAPISYAYMTESIGENFEGGAIQSKFYAGGDVVPDLWWGIEMMGAPLSNWSSPLNGKLSEEIVYKKPASGALFPVKKTQYTYSLDDRLHTRVYGYTINHRYIGIGSVPPPTLPCADPASAVGGPLGSPINEYDCMRYKIDAYWAHVDTLTETLYDENGQNPVITVTSNIYDNITNLQPTKSEFSTSKGEVIQKLMTYPSDYEGTNAYDILLAKNIINPVIDFKSKSNSSTVAEQKTNYGIFNFSSSLPQTVQAAVKGNALETEGTIDVYDNNENILQFTNKAGVPTAIIWGYNNQYPVAQVVGATYATAVAQLTGGLPTALQTMDGTTLQTELNRIRTGIPTARVTSYTYKHMTGVTSITDPNNKTNTYDYDSFNRLLTVKDQDGNVVKKNQYVYTTVSNSSPAIYFNEPQTINVACQTCIYGYAAAIVQYNIPLGKYYSLISVADANAKALADADAQEYANKNGKCINTSCTSMVPCTNCTGDNKKCINGVCETGVRINVSTAQGKFGAWICTYYYHFSDNSTYPAQAPYLSETNSSPCEIWVEQ
jgi:YD repeat-containing protein